MTSAQDCRSEKRALDWAEGQRRAALTLHHGHRERRTKCGIAGLWKDSAEILCTKQDPTKSSPSFDEKTSIDRPAPPFLSQPPHLDRKHDLDDYALLNNHGDSHQSQNRSNGWPDLKSGIEWECNDALAMLPLSGPRPSIGALTSSQSTETS